MWKCQDPCWFCQQISCKINCQNRDLIYQSINLTLIWFLIIGGFLGKNCWLVYIYRCIKASWVQSFLDISVQAAPSDHHEFLQHVWGCFFSTKGGVQSTWIWSIHNIICSFHKTVGVLTVLKWTWKTDYCNLCFF